MAAARQCQAARRRGVARDFRSIPDDRALGRGRPASAEDMVRVLGGDAQTVTAAGPGA